MKTKFLFASMVLATAFAACTNEEIVENVAVDDVQGRLEFAAPAVSVGNGVDSRFAWDATAGAWEDFTANDKFSAGLMDVTKFTTLTDAPLTNYVFSSADAGETYTTTSKMKEGVYFFYSYPGFEKESERVAVPFDLTESQQEIDLADPTANVNANQLFVSALYKVEAKNADEALPVQFYSYWSTAGLKIKNATSQDFKIVRIVLAGAANDQFLVKGTLNPKELGTPAVKNADLENEYIYYYEDGKYVLPYKNLKDKTKGRVDADGIRTATMAKAATDGKQGAIMVDVKNGTVAAGETTVAYIQMPAGSYAESSIVAKIHVEVYDEVKEEKVVKELEAEFVTNHTATVDGVETEYIRLRRGKAYSAFGAEPFAIDELSLNVATEGIGAYAASYEDLYQLTVKEDQTKIYNIGSLKMDDQAITLMNRLAEKDNTVYEFQNPIVVTSSKKTVNSLSNVKFLAGASIENGKFAIKNNAVPTDQTLVVNDNVELTITKTQSGTIENHNKVTVNADATGKITVGKDENGKYHLTEVVLAYEDAAVSIVGLTAPSTLTINEDVAVNVPNTATGYINPYGSTIVNNGTLNAGNNILKNEGTITNNGTIVSVRNIGSWDTTNDAAKTATVDNYGTIKQLKSFNYSLVTMKSADSVIEEVLNNGDNYSTAPATDLGGDIDNTVGGFITLGTNPEARIYKKYTENVTGALDLVQSQNAAILDGCTWTLSASADYTVPAATFTKGIEMNNVTVKQLDGDGEITAKKVIFGTTLLKATNVTFNCNTTIATTAATDDVALDLSGSTFKGTLTLSAANYAKLNDTTFGGAATLSTLKELNLYGTVNINAALTVSAATKMNIGYVDGDGNATSTTVNVNANVTASAVTGVKIEKSAKLVVNVGKTLTTGNTSVFEVDGSVSNYGTIVGGSKSVTSTTSITGKWAGNDIQ